MAETEGTSDSGETNASLLGISEGSIVWVIGDTVEETALVDPLSEVVDEPVDEMDAVILIVDDRDEVADRLDDVLPAVGSAPSVWLVFPTGDQRLTREWLAAQVEDYGWTMGPEVELEDDWTAARLRQD